MSKTIVGFIGMFAMLAPVGASAMPAAGLAPVAAPQAATVGATLERAAVIVRTGPVVRRGFVGRPIGPRPFVRRGVVGRPGIGVGIGPRGGVGVRIR